MPDELGQNRLALPLGRVLVVRVIGRLNQLKVDVFSQSFLVFGRGKEYTDLLTGAPFQGAVAPGSAVVLKETAKIGAR